MRQTGAPDNDDELDQCGGLGPSLASLVCSRSMLYILISYKIYMDWLKDVGYTKTISCLCDINFMTALCLDSSLTVIFRSKKNRSDKLWHMWRWVSETPTVPRLTLVPETIHPRAAHPKGQKVLPSTPFK